MPPENNDNQRRTAYSDVSDVADAIGGAATAVGETVYGAGQSVGRFTGEKIRQSVANVEDVGMATQSYFTPRGNALPVSGTYEGGAPDTDQTFTVGNTNEQQTQPSQSDRTGGGGSFGPSESVQGSAQTPRQETQQRAALTSRDIQSMTSPVSQVFGTNPADTLAIEPNVESQLDGGEISQGSSQNLPPQAQRENDFQETLTQVEQEVRNILQDLNGRSPVDFSPSSRPVRETDEQRQMIEQADEPDTLRQRMDEVREQFNMPELEKQRANIMNEIQATRDAFGKAINNLDEESNIFGELERRRIQNLSDQRDRRLQNLGTVLQRTNQQIDAINTRVNQEVQAEQVRDQREQEQAQEQRQRVGNLIETGALANMSDQEITSIAQESGYTPQTLARVRQAQQQSLQQVDATGSAGEFQDLKRMGAIGEDVTYQQFLQMENQSGGDGGAARFQQEFSAAQQYANNNIMNTSRQQLINQINQTTTELSAGEIEDIVSVAEQQAGPQLRVQRFAREVQSLAQEQQLRGASKSEAREQIMRNWASSQGLDDTDDIQDSTKNIIRKLVNRTYGEQQQ